MRLGLGWRVPVGVRVAVVVGIVLAGIGVRPSAAGAQGTERIVTASATCVGATDEREPLAWVNVFNRSGMPIWLIAVDGLSTSQAFNPFFLEEPLDGLLDVEVPDGERVAVDARWTGLIGGDGEGLDAGAVVVTSAGVLTPICGGRPQDAGRPVIDGPDPGDRRGPAAPGGPRHGQDPRQARGLAGLPLLHALLHPDVRATLDLDRLTCWYVGEYGGRLDPDRLDIFTTTVSAAEVEPWAGPVTGEEYAAAVVYDYEQAVGTVAETETISGTAHLVQEDGVWRWFFGTSQAGMDALPETCGG